MNKIIISLIMMVVSSFVHSEDQECAKNDINFIVNNMNIKDYTDSRESACKIIDNIKYVTFIYPVHNENNKDSSEEGFIIALIDIRHNKIIGSRFSKVSYDDNYYISALRLDTARYDVSPSIRAFGIDMEWWASTRCRDKYSGPSRMLYINKNSKITPILDSDLELSSTEYSGEHGACSGQEIDITKETKVAVKISNNKSNVFSDMDLNLNVIFEKDSTVICSINKNFPIKYDGKFYSIKKFNNDVDDFFSKSKKCKF